MQDFFCETDAIAEIKDKVIGIKAVSYTHLQGMKILKMPGKSRKQKLFRKSRKPMKV